MLNKNSQAIIKHHAHVINIFGAYVDLNITSLIDIIDKIMVEDHEINHYCHAALGLTIANIGEIAERNYEQFRATFSERIMLTEQHKLSHIGNELIKDNVEDTLSGIVEVLRVVALSFTESFEGEHSANLAEFQGLHTTLHSIKSAATLCAQVILDTQEKDDPKNLKSGHLH